MNDRSLREHVVRAAREGGSIACESFREEHTVETKAGPMDAVTAIDHRVQAYISSVVDEVDSEAVVVGEEGDAPSTVPESGRAWVVDPIDGTNNYVAGNRLWATSIAVLEDGAARVAVNHFPALGDTYVGGPRSETGGYATRNAEQVGVSDTETPGTFIVGTIFGFSPIERAGLASVTSLAAERFGDTRQFGSAQATLSMLASGELDGVVSTARLNPWDTVAGVALVRLAGGTVTDLRGDHWKPESTGLVASNGTAHEAFLEVVQSVETA
ncbi:MAG: inositol monophosphatase family protein [Halobacteriota archaeon]